MKVMFKNLLLLIINSSMYKKKIGEPKCKLLE